MIWPRLQICFLYSLQILALPSPNRQEKRSSYWLTQAQDQLRSNLRKSLHQKHAKNVILFLGDGMGASVVTSARIYRGQTDGLESDQTPLAWEHFPFTGLAKTYNVDRHTTDSAAAANAFLTGVKTHHATVAVGSQVERGDCDTALKNMQTSIAAWAIEAGKWSGLVTNTRITHATPSVFYAHSADREWENDAWINENNINCKDIARQLIEDFPGNELKVVFGGGRKNFIPNTVQDVEKKEFGLRLDGRNLIDEWLAGDKNRKFISNRTELLQLDANEIGKIMGLFDYNHLPYEALLPPKNDKPNLSEMTATAIEVLSKGDNGYFLLVEGGRMDHGFHENHAKIGLEEVKAFNKAVDTALKMINQDDTLVVVTADHSHSMNLLMFPHRNTSILGTFYGEKHRDNMPSTLLVFADGPSAMRRNGTKRRNLTGVDTESVYFEQPALIPATKESHGGEEVAVYARGPLAHLFTGVMEQNYIAHAMAYAACIGVSEQLCKTDPITDSDSSVAFYSWKWILLLCMAACSLICNFVLISLICIRK